tara:strand:- start:22955 stop:23359 length:405 start_codon:yes stop_codon:yes gene_type:complete
MKYSIKAESYANNDALLDIKAANIKFGTTSTTSDSLPNPAELFLGSLAACILKSVERFSGMMKFNYSKASISVIANRLENPPRMDWVNYELTVYSQDEKLNVLLLQKNIEKHGTIFNTVQQSCTISGHVHIQKA